MQRVPFCTHSFFCRPDLLIHQIGNTPHSCGVDTLRGMSLSFPPLAERLNRLRFPVKRSACRVCEPCSFWAVSPTCRPFGQTVWPVGGLVAAEIRRTFLSSSSAQLSCTSAACI